MARRPLTDRFTRSLIQVGGKSLCVTIPIEYLEKLDWSKGQEIEVKLQLNKKRLILKEKSD